MTQASVSDVTSAYDVVVIGAGFSGLYAVHKLRGHGLSVRAYEKGTGVGGVWYWNRYPGARVDVRSLEYSFTFSAELEEEWKWSQQYAPQPELEAYLNHVADRFDLRRDIQLETRVVSTHYDESANRWIVTTDRGDRVEARYLVMASGSLSTPKDIDLPGIDRFKGELYRTSDWPRDREVSFAGKRVGEVGTGSSGIQVVTEIAKTAGHLTVFQRTAGFSLPSHNGPTDQKLTREWFEQRDEMYLKQRHSPIGSLLLSGSLVQAGFPEKSALEVTEEERQQAYEGCWRQGGFSIIGAFNDLMINKASNDTAADFVRGKIRSIVKDPAVAEKLSPYTHPILTKRPCVDSGYYETFNRDNVDLVDLRENPIETITETGLIAGGKHYEFDMLVLAIGFDAMTGAMSRIDIRGRNGLSLKEVWEEEGPVSFLGLGVAGFPNMFMVSGPGSPSVLGNVIRQFELNIDWIAECIDYLGEHQLDVIEVDPAAQESWTEEVRTIANGTLFPLADSWYIGANVPGKKRAFAAYVGGWSNYLDKCDEVAANGYSGFKVGRAEVLA